MKESSVPAPQSVHLKTRIQRLAQNVVARLLKHRYFARPLSDMRMIDVSITSSSTQRFIQAKLLKCEERTTGENLKEKVLFAT
jgi:hypothetical protein